MKDKIGIWNGGKPRYATQEEMDGLFQTKEYEFDYSKFKAKRKLLSIKFCIDGKWIKYNKITKRWSEL